MDLKKLFHRDPMAGLITIEAYAAAKGVNPTTIYRWCDNGKITAAVKIIKGQKYVNKIKADALLATPETGRFRDLQLALARCKSWCRQRRYTITVTALLLVILVFLPGILADYVRRGQELKSLHAENEVLRQTVNDLLGLSEKYTGLLEVGDALGLDVDTASDALLEQNPNVAVPELTLFALLDRSSYFAGWIEQEVDTDRERLDDYAETAAITPNAWPVRGSVTSEFGNRYAARGTMLSRAIGYIGFRWHTGIDIAGKVDTSVTATAAGEVVYAGDKESYGNLVIVKHGDTYLTYYAHLSRITVEVGDNVARGDRVGTVGSTGTSTGPHLHYEVRVYGHPTDPRRYLP